jgi:hypothetical protein
MRVDPHSVGSCLHVVQRGARGAHIVRDRADREWFARTLFHLNDTHAEVHWRREVSQMSEVFNRPRHWPERESLVRILAWTLLTNHFHLVLQEVRAGGIAKFMQRLNGSLTTGYNAKYGERGSLFQGGYRGAAVATDSHIEYLAFYVLVKNVLEMYPGGLLAAQRDFDCAWEWALRYPYSSLGALCGNRASLIEEDPEGLFKTACENPDAFKTIARELLDEYLSRKNATEFVV